jgi:hypothetical protein
MDDYCKKSKVPETAMFKPQQQYRRCVAETFKVFPPSAVVLIDSLLSLEPEVRGTASSALQSDVSFIFFCETLYLHGYFKISLVEVHVGTQINNISQVMEKMSNL